MAVGYNKFSLQVIPLSQMTLVNKIIVLTVIPIPLFFLRRIFNSVHESRSTDYCIGRIRIQYNRIIISLLIFPIFVEIFTVEPTCTINIIAKNVPILLLVVEVHGGCFQVFSIWKNRIFGDPFWKILIEFCYESH